MKQAARSGFCFVLVLGMKLCTHDSTALSPDLCYCGVSSTWVSFILLPGLLGFCVLTLNLLMPAQVTHLSTGTGGVGGVLLWFWPLATGKAQLLMVRHL